MSAVQLILLKFKIIEFFFSVLFSGSTAINIKREIGIYDQKTTGLVGLKTGRLFSI